MKEDKEIEKMLLSDEEFESFVNQKTEQDFEKELEHSVPKVSCSEDFNSVPKEKLFSKNAIYSVINKTSRTKSYINGVQAEGFLGSQEIVRDNFLSKKTNSFVAGDMYIKFYKYKV